MPDLKPSKNVRKTNTYLKYSGIGFQMAAFVGLSLWVGTKIDRYFAFEKPIATIILILVAFTLYMVKLYFDLIKK